MENKEFNKGDTVEVIDQGSTLFGMRGIYSFASNNHNGEHWIEFQDRSGGINALKLHRKEFAKVSPKEPVKFDFSDINTAMNNFIMTQDKEERINGLYPSQTRVVPDTNYPFSLDSLRYPVKPFQTIFGEDNKTSGHYCEVLKPNHYMVLPGVEVRHICKAMSQRLQKAGYSAMFISDYIQFLQYILRFDAKEDPKKDLKKARTYFDWILEDQGIETDNSNTYVDYVKQGE